MDLELEEWITLQATAKFRLKQYQLLQCHHHISMSLSNCHMYRLHTLNS